MESASDCRYAGHLKSFLYSLSKRCAIGPRDGSEAAEVCKVLGGHDIASTLGKLSRSGDDPVRIVQEYQLASNSLKSSPATDRFYLSLKPPALNFDTRHAAAIVATALQNGHGVHFDAHGFAYAEQSLTLLEAVMQLHPHSKGRARNWSFGLTLPSRWKRSLSDARWAAGKGVRPRVVKGDFRAGPADEVDPGKGFLALVDQLAGHVSELAVATHDCALAREAVLRCKRAGSAVELELFFGMPSASMMAMSWEMEVPVRFYVPYGDTLLIYLVRDLLTNPHKVLRRSAFEVLGSPKTKLARIIASL